MVTVTLRLMRVLAVIFIISKSTLYRFLWFWSPLSMHYFFPCYLTSLFFFLQGNWNALVTVTVANFKYYLYFDTLGLTIYRVFHSTQAKCNSSIFQTIVPMFFSSSCRSFFVKPKSNHLFQCFAALRVLFGYW